MPRPWGFCSVCLFFAPATVCQSNGDTHCRLIEGNYFLLFMMVVLGIVLAIVLVMLGLSEENSRRGG